MNLEFIARKTKLSEKTRFPNPRSASCCLVCVQPPRSDGSEKHVADERGAWSAWILIGLCGESFDGSHCSVQGGGAESGG